LFELYQGDMKMKLKLLFIVMDLLTILAYPFILAHGKLRQYLKSKNGNLSVDDSAPSGR
jgi:hypothetical protein